MHGKTLVLIDGSNFYHNVKTICRDLRIRPGKIDFNKLAELISRKFRLRPTHPIRYYNSIPSIKDGADTYYRHQRYLSHLKKQGIKVITRKLQRNNTREVQAEKQEIINSLELCRDCKPIVKSNCVDCIGNVKQKEKGVDIIIAVDMIDLCIIRKEFDNCVLISGDADFIPAFNLLKNASVKVYSASVYKGYSYNLRQSFKYHIITLNDIKSCLREDS